MNISASTLPKRLVGQFLFAGDLDVNGESISGCALEIDRETLISAESLPMYDQCVILPAADLEDMKSMQTHRRVMDWHSQSDEGLRLRCGELTPQEIRTIRSVLNAILLPDVQGAARPADA